MQDSKIEPAKIDPDAIYHDGQIRLILGLAGATLCRARRDGSLRYSRKGNTTLYRGQWILDWLDDSSKTSGGDHE